MAGPFNPYAPPVAEVDNSHQVGVVTRDGVLVRMDRNGQLPERCVACNGPALPDRVSRTLYWTRWEWRLALWGIPAFLLAVMTTGNSFAMGLFFPAVLVLAIVNMIVRARVGVEIGLCARHLKIRRTLSALIWTCCAVSVALPFVSMSLGSDRIGTIVLVILALMLVLGVAHAYSAANRLAVKRLTPRHVWLKGAGASFRDSLPEASPE